MSNSTEPRIPQQPDSLRTPEAQASVNAMVSAAVTEAIKGVFSQLVPVLKDMALTPEKLREANKPYVDPAKIARELRETMKSKEDEAELRRQVAARQAACPHLDKNGNDSISLVHNGLDHQTRGICMLCHDWIHPREWVIDAPDPVTGKTKAHIRPEHKDYHRVMRMDAMQ